MDRTEPLEAARRTRRSRGRLWAPLAAASILLAATVPLGCTSDEERAAQFMEQGTAYAEEEQWPEAIIEFRNVLQLDPNNSEAHFELAKAYLRVEKIREAYWEFHETARLDPENVEARLAYGQMSLAARDFEAALAEAEAIVAVDESSDVGWVLKGQALEGLGRPEEALEPYERARAAKPDQPAHLLILAGYHQRQGDSVKAEELLRELVAADPAFAGYTSLGRLLARDPERKAEALDAFESALEVAEPEQKKDAYRNLAVLHYNAERYDDAARTLERGIEDLDDKLDLIYLLARFHRARGDEAKADALVEEATRANPEDPRPFLVLSTYRGQKGDLQGALAAAEQALEVAPDDRASKLRKAELLVDIGYRGDDRMQIAEGRSIVEAVLAVEPTHPAALFVRAKIELAEGDPEAAAASLRSVIEAEPGLAKAHFVLGSALAATGDLSGARAEFARSLELDPSLNDARRLLTRIHGALGEHEYAIDNGRKYLREQPDHSETRILVAQSLVRLGRLKEASAELEKIPAEDRGPEALYALARLKAASGDLQGSRELLLRADSARPNHPEVLRELLSVDRRLGNIDEAVARIDAAVKAEPQVARLAMLQGLTFLLRGKPEAAEDAFKRAIELDPSDLSAYEQLAYLYRVTGQIDKTVETYEQAVATNDENARLHHFLGVLYEVAGEQDKAVAAYERAIERDRSLGESMNNLAYLLAERGEDLDRALDLAQEAKALLPDSANAADTLGWVLYKRGVASAAVGYLREAEAGMDPNEDNLGIVRHHLALAYEASGEPEKAVVVLERAVATAERQQQAVRDAGREPREPTWLPEVRAMLDRLQSATG